jgi:hypothetical protein
MDYPTAPHIDNNMTLVPKLTRGGDGWNGKSENWRVVDNIIRIKNSDGSLKHVPTPEQRIRTVDNEGHFSHHVQINSGDPLYQLWVGKIGPYLGDWVLGKARHGASSFTSSGARARGEGARTDKGLHSISFQTRPSGSS